MKEFKTLLFSLTIFLTTSLTAQSSTKYWSADNSLATELKVLIESIKLDYLTEEESSALKADLMILESLLTNLNKKDQFFLTKTSIYKWLLRNSPQIQVPSDFRIIEIVEKKITPKSTFSMWLYLSLKSDVQNLTNDPSYNAYRRKKINNKSVQRLTKKIDLLKGWVYLICTNSADQLDLRLLKYQSQMLKSVISQIELFYRFDNKALPTPKEKLSLFSLNKVIKNEQQDQTATIVESVVEQAKSLPQPVSDWDENDDFWTPKDKSKPLGNQHYIQKDYEAPNQLPQPVNDWIFDY